LHIAELYKFHVKAASDAMPDSSYLRSQADIFDRVADQCTVPELVPYYRKLAQDYRARVESEGGGRKRSEPPE
jgi:hypothetical protein